MESLGVYAVHTIPNHHFKGQFSALSLSHRGDLELRGAQDDKWGSEDLRAIGIPGLGVNRPGFWFYVVSRVMVP